MVKTHQTCFLAANGKERRLTAKPTFGAGPVLHVCPTNIYCKKVTKKSAILKKLAFPYNEHYLLPIFA